MTRKAVARQPAAARLKRDLSERLTVRGNISNIGHTRQRSSKNHVIRCMSSREFANVLFALGAMGAGEMAVGCLLVSVEWRNGEMAVCVVTSVAPPCV